MLFRGTFSSFLLFSFGLSPLAEPLPLAFRHFSSPIKPISISVVLGYSRSSVSEIDDDVLCCFAQIPTCATCFRAAPNPCPEFTVIQLRRMIPQRHDVKMRLEGCKEKGPWSSYAIRGA